MRILASSTKPPFLSDSDEPCRPRPHAVDHNELYLQGMILATCNGTSSKPGMTGLAQVERVATANTTACI